MNDPFQIIPWAVAIGVAWVILGAMTGLDDFLKKLAGRKDKTADLEAKIVALEKRVAQLEANSAASLSAK